jgi:hypothetical protein
VYAYAGFGMTRSKRSRLYGTVSVDVDIQDDIAQLDDDDILELAESVGCASKANAREAALSALDAIGQIRRGNHADAITTLERAFLPKWQGVDACRCADTKALL